MKKVVVNSSNSEEVRVAMLEGNQVIDLDIQSVLSENRKSNVYKGVVTHVEPSLEAAFVDYGAERQGFLPFKELSQDLFSVLPEDFVGNSSISDILQEGQEIVVQVQKEERGTKGAALTTLVGLAGTYIVMMPNSPKLSGISKQIDRSDRGSLKQQMLDLSIESGVGIILRTAGLDRTKEEIQWNIDYLQHLWTMIQESVASHTAPCLIYKESDVVIRAIRDHLFYDISEIFIDDDETFERVKKYLEVMKPEIVAKLRKHTSSIPIFSKFQIESQIEAAFAHMVQLPSGGEIVIDVTEALIAVDVNSSRANKGNDVEETAHKTNLEAAVEIAKQVRLRDLGGLIIIDFIDMKSNAHIRDVERCLNHEIRKDRARTQVSNISKFGLVEMSRQRLGSALRESSHLLCPRCQGRAIVRSVESIGFSILRIIEEYAVNDSVNRINIDVPIDVATFLINKKRDQLQAIEQDHGVQAIINPVESMHTPDYKIETNIPRIKIYYDDTTGSKFRHNESQSQSKVSDEKPILQNPMQEYIKSHGVAKTPNRFMVLFTKFFRMIFGQNKPQGQGKPTVKNRSNARSTTRRAGGQSKNRSGARHNQNRNTTSGTSSNVRPNKRRPNKPRNSQKKYDLKTDKVSVPSAKNSVNMNEDTANKQHSKGSKVVSKRGAKTAKSNNKVVPKSTVMIPTSSENVKSNKSDTKGKNITSLTSAPTASSETVTQQPAASKVDSGSVQPQKKERATRRNRNLTRRN